MTSARLGMLTQKVLTPCQHFLRLEVGGGGAEQAQGARLRFDVRRQAVRDARVDTVSTQSVLTEATARLAAQRVGACVASGCEFVRSVCVASVDTVSTLWRRRVRRRSPLLPKAKSPRLRGLLAFMGNQMKGVGGRQ